MATEPTHTRFEDFPVHSDVGFTFGDPTNPTVVGGAVAPATTTVAGVVKEMPAMADLTGTNPVTVAQFNALLAALRTAGMLAP